MRRRFARVSFKPIVFCRSRRRRRRRRHRHRRRRRHRR